MTSTRLLAAVAALTLALAGCGVDDPYEGQNVEPPGAGQQAPDNNDVATEDLSEPDQTTGVTTPPNAAGDTKGAERVAREYAATALTYSPDTYASQQRALRERATGALRDDLSPAVPDEDTAKTLAASDLTSRAQVLVSDVEKSSGDTASIIVMLKVFTGRNGSRSTAPSYQPYRMEMRRVKGSWKVAEMGAP